MRDSATAGRLIELPVFVDGGNIFDMIEATKILDVVALRNSLDKRVRTYEEGYYSLTDVRLAYETPEPRDMQLAVAENVGYALREKLIPNKFDYHHLRKCIPQLDKDINEWFAKEKVKAKELRDRNTVRDREDIVCDARNGLRTLPV